MYGPSDGQAAFMMVLMFLGVTFGLWKLAEIAWWLVTHVRISW